MWESSLLLLTRRDASSGFHGMSFAAYFHFSWRQIMISTRSELERTKSISCDSTDECRNITISWSAREGFSTTSYWRLTQKTEPPLAATSQHTKQGEQHQLLLIKQAKSTNQREVHNSRSKPEKKQKKTKNENLTKVFPSVFVKSGKLGLVLLLPCARPRQSRH